MASTRSSGPAPNPVEVASRLRVILARLVRLTRQDSASSGMTSAQLSALASIDARGMLRLGELAAIEGVVPSTMTRLVASLELHGLVKRAPSPDDGRSSVVGATEAGMALLVRLRCDYVSELAERLAALDRRTLEHIVAALPGLEAIVADSP